MVEKSESRGWILGLSCLFVATTRCLTHELEYNKSVSHQVSVMPFGILWNSIQLHFSGHYF